jgi:hypothetical protein
VRRILSILAAALTLTACGGADAPPRAATATATPHAKAKRREPPVLCRAKRGRIVGRLTDPGLDEISGLARSGGQLWAVEDSGAAPALIALEDNGGSLGATTVSGAIGEDWEDIAAAGDELFVGDIGDNERSRAGVEVYRVAAPAPGAAATGPATTLDLVYPDGPHDAEALLADPVRGEVVIISKDVIGTRAYTAPLDGSATKLRRSRPISATTVTGAGLSADGRIVVLRSYSSLSVWRRHGDEPLARTLVRPPCVAPANLSTEGQGEAVALSERGRVAFTLPEGTGAALRRYAAR